MNDDDLLTIGQLANEAQVPTSTLRYYEKEELLLPNARSPAGYRLYRLEAAHRLRLIRRAQRLGFSLADIRTLLAGWEAGDLSNDAVIAVAEERYFALERRVTELLVLQHELELFLRDLSRPGKETDTALADLLLHVCADPGAPPTSTTLLEWLRRYTGCVLTTEEGQALLDRLRGEHVHIWQENDAYHILIPSHNPAVGEALRDLARLEANCQVHAHPQPQLSTEEEGYLFVARGANAFIFARIFLTLEQPDTPIP